MASKVFPHPGGPANSMPWALDKPRSLNASGCLTGAYLNKIYNRIAIRPGQSF